MNRNDILFVINDCNHQQMYQQNDNIYPHNNNPPFNDGLL